MALISIERVLHHFDNTMDEKTMEVNEYRVRFITADGRLRTMRARKLTKEPMRQLRSPLSSRGGIQFNLKRNSTMMMEDIDRQEPRAVKVAMITSFKEKNSNWLTVFH
jgi:hypothetical protein